MRGQRSGVWGYRGQGPGVIGSGVRGQGYGVLGVMGCRVTGV